MLAASAHIALKTRLSRIWFFFPFQLLVLHAKKNHFLLVFWLVAFGFSTGLIGARYGVDHLFLYPEYMGTNGPMAFFLLGFTIGGFVLAFNLYSYILHGFRFPFIATLSKPFLKFSVNNFLLPAVFLLVYCICSYRFQRTEALLDSGEALFNLSALVGGLLLFSAATLTYFAITNKSAQNFAERHEHERHEKNLVSATLHRPGRWYPNERKSRAWRVETYLSSPFQIKLAREGEHYHPEVLERVFSQNHINASLLEIGLIVTFVLIGSFSRNEYFVIPGAASVFIFFSMLLMLVSALFSWVKGWTFSLLVAALVLVNFTYHDLPLFNVPTHAYGLDYDAPPAEYSSTYIHGQNHADSLAYADFQATLKMLEAWKARQPQEKPSLVLVLCSGGGTRASLWTYSTLARMDSLLEGELMDRTFMITGSSGGMIGASYFRELKWREAQGLDCNPQLSDHYEAISGDLLNPLLFSAATNDFFFRFREYQYGGDSYTLDRASVFEERLHANTGGVMEKPLGAYKAAEACAEIPWMIFTPSITRDGRRMLISAQPASYLTQNEAANIRGSSAVPEDVEFLRLFAEHQPDSVRFSSVLRMNATFPYVLPTVNLPTDPPIEVMDAGMRDNFGTKTTVQFLYTFREWIQENTHEVIVVQIRDLQKDFTSRDEEQSLVGQLTAPIGSVYGNFTRMQDFEHDEHMRYLEAWLDKPVNLVTFSLTQKPDEKISLSFHLTQAEKQRITRAVHSRDFDRPLDLFKSTLERELVQAPSPTP